MEQQAGPSQAGKRLAPLGASIAVVALILSVIAVAVPTMRPTAAPETRKFVLSSDVLNGSNRWYPSSLVAYAGDTIVFNVTNRGSVQHGFSVEGLGIADVVDPGQSKEFTVPRVAAGLYRFFCQLHSGHLGGQLLVLSR